MKNLKIYLTTIITLIATLCNAQSSYETIIKDLQKISGSWQGSLTYLDYSSGKPYTMAADIEIKQIENTNRFLFSNNYPKEKDANSNDTITISNDGKYINKELVKSRQELPNGNIEITTEEKGLDGNDNKPALFRHTYTFGKENLKMRKDIQFVGKNEWINRHEYSHDRKLSK